MKIEKKILIINNIVKCVKMCEMWENVWKGKKGWEPTEINDIKQIINN